ncbi:unnamed protein product [Ostreobium quekettii]|uniref:Uncharacterized protein n=1 Tax=Ostreobium quekettii TaxID=121088 RepID=A0A8S1ISG4_9CHLO|nr:unnamed protein product [Ostreobium quekettii]|eukprot:evm.model.scf_1932.4 EVM.evm.TU.scf_1932.4   scf_1932:25652-28593(-)
MPSQILFSLVARGPVVLAECSTVSGNAIQIAHRILEKMPTTDTRVSYTQERHMYHVLIVDGITYLCMSEEGFGRRIPYAFLEDVKNKFVTTYGSAAMNAVAYEYSTDFSRVLEQQMDYFSNDPNADAITRARGGIAEVKNVMIENIEKVLERGERIELLVDKTDHLSSEAFMFRKEARKLRNKMRWKNIKLALIIALIIFVIVMLITAFVCGPTWSKCSSKKNHHRGLL